MALRKLVVIEEGLLANMAANALFVAEFPFLQQLKQSLPTNGKKPCCGHKSTVAATAFDAVKAAIAGLSSDRKRRLKEMLNAEQVRVNYRVPGTGKPVELTFR
jgi:hypothetical protein